MAGMPIAGVGTIFYGVLLLGMGATKLWRWALRSIRPVGTKWEEKPADTSVLANRGFRRSRAPSP
jgi:hypothetical protein